MLDGSYFIECRCGSVGHTIRFILDREDKQMYLETQMDHCFPWYKRIWPGIKYIFGSKAHGTYWDDWIMDENNIEQMKKMINDFEMLIRE